MLMYVCIFSILLVLIQYHLHRIRRFENYYYDDNSITWYVKYENNEYNNK